MFDKYTLTSTYSVTVSLSALEKYIDADLREMILKGTHVNSINDLHLQVDPVSDGITFYSIKVSEV